MMNNTTNNTIDAVVVKEEFLEVARNNIKREGIEDFLSRLEKSDFFKAPASTKYHNACEGGLVDHSLKVYYRLLESYDFLKSKYPELTDEQLKEKLAIVALFHDACKIGFYKLDVRNVKNEETGKWEKVPYYTIDDKLPFGHGEKSVIFIMKCMELENDEIGAILAHMGDFTDGKTGNLFEMYPLALELHIADLRASKYDEETVKN